jgi:hypothetical protein
MSRINFFAVTDARGQEKVFGIKQEDRRLHMYVIGRTGMGKTTLLLNMILNDIYAGEGLCFIDPHGDAVEALLDYIPDSRVNDVIYFNPADIEHPIPLNILERVPQERRHILVSHVLSIFRKLYPEHWQHRQEHIMRNALLVLLERDEPCTLLDVYWLLADWRYRKKVTAGVKDPLVKAFWTSEFSRYIYQYKGEALAPIQNKLGAFLTSPLVRNILGQKENKIDFRAVMDEGKVLLVNLSRGRIGEDSSSFLGSLIATRLQLAAMSRVDIREGDRRDFYLYVDEFQHFVAAETFDSVLSEARKYRLCLTLAHQYIGQLDERLRKAVFGNVGTTVVFPMGLENSESLEREFYPELKLKDLVGQVKHHIYLKLAIDGTTSKPFSARTLPPFYNFEFQGKNEDIVRLSRTRYSAKGEPDKSSGKRETPPRQLDLFAGG